jgi:hypothetical protein
MAQAVGRFSRRLADGIPTGFVAALAVLVLVAILFTAASGEDRQTRGYTELTLFPDGCLIDKGKQSNAVRCQVIGPGSYRVFFASSLAGSTPIASRGSCCPGAIGASVESDHSVTISVRRLKPKQAIRLSVLVP